MSVTTENNNGVLCHRAQRTLAHLPTVGTPALRAHLRRAFQPLCVEPH